MLKFSLLMSVYKTENPIYLNDAFKSIWKDQLLKPNQIIIVLDGLIPQQLHDVINVWKHKIGDIMKVISLKENRGLGEALAFGIKFCDYEYIARMDTDDISMPNRFYEQINFLEENKNIDIVGSYAIEFDKKVNVQRGFRYVPENHEDILKFSRYRNPFNHPSVIYRKSKVIEAGGPINFTDFDDYYLWVKMLHVNARCANIAKPLIYMRANADQSRRRGGYSYIKNEIKFLNFLVGINHINLIEFCRNLLIRLPIRLIPHKLRYLLYKLLRK